MKRKANKLIIGIIFLAGLSLLLYPFVANQWNNYRQKQLISSYEQTVSEKDAAHEIDYDAELQKAEATFLRSSEMRQQRQDFPQTKRKQRSALLAALFLLPEYTPQRTSRCTSLPQI